MSIPFNLRGLNQTYQIDLADMQITEIDVNGGFVSFLTVIDVFSKFGWAIPIKNKSADKRATAKATILTKEREPKK